MSWFAGGPMVCSSVTGYSATYVWDGNPLHSQRDGDSCFSTVTVYLVVCRCM